MNLSQVLKNFISYTSGTAVVLNLLLLPMVCLRSGKEIGSYKVLLFLYVLIATVHASLTVTSVPMCETSPLGWIFYATVQRIPRELGSYFMCSYSATYIKLLMILTYSFIYRYIVVCCPHQMKWFQNTLYVTLLVCVYLSVVFICNYPVVIFFRVNKVIADTVTVVSVGGLDLRLEDTFYIGAPMFTNGTLVIETMLTLSLWSGVIIAASGISLFCSLKIVCFFRDADSFHLSPIIRRLQRRLFLLLILQTLVPMVFTFTPSFLSFVLSYFCIYAPKFTEVSSALLPITQLLDPIYIFVLIADYRSFVVRVIKKYVFRMQSVSSLAETITTVKIELC